MQEQHMNQCTECLVAERRGVREHMQFSQTEIMNCSSQCKSEAHAAAELRQVEKDLRDERDSAHIAYQLEETDAVIQSAHFQVKVAAERERVQRAEVQLRARGRKVC